MSSPITGRSARKTAATRELIVDVAQALLEEGGPDALTLPAVSERADVAVQTVYNRVGGRSALLMAVAERALADNRKYMDEAYSFAGTAPERILMAGAAYARFAIERPHQFRLLADPPEAMARVVALVVEQNGKMAEVLQAGMEDGTINPDLDAAHTATAIWGMMNGLLALSWRPDELRTHPDTLLTSLGTLISHGLGPRPA